MSDSLAHPTTPHVAGINGAAAAGSNVSPQMLAEQYADAAAKCIASELNAAVVRAQLAIAWNAQDSQGQKALADAFRTAFKKRMKAREDALGILYADINAAARQHLNRLKKLAKEAADVGATSHEMLLQHLRDKTIAKATRDNAKSADDASDKATPALGEHATPGAATPAIEPGRADELVAAFTACRGILNRAKLSFANGGDETTFKAQWSRLAALMRELGYSE